MATLRLVFRVSKVQQYSDNFVQDLLRAGLSSVMHGKPMEVPEFGLISAIILLGSKTILSSVDSLWPDKWMFVVGVTEIDHSCALSQDFTGSTVLLSPFPQGLVGSRFMLLEMRRRVSVCLLDKHCFQSHLLVY